MLTTVEVIRKNGAFIKKDEYPFIGKSIQEICNKLDSRIKRESDLIDGLPFNSINIVLEGVVMMSRYDRGNWE